jgi:hypothetical protein
VFSPGQRIWCRMDPKTHDPEGFRSQQESFVLDTRFEAYQWIWVWPAKCILDVEGPVEVRVRVCAEPQPGTK